MNFINIVSLLGFSGLFIYFYGRRKACPRPVKVKIFGTIRTFHEIGNIFDKTKRF